MLLGRKMRAMTKDEKERNLRLISLTFHSHVHFLGRRETEGVPYDNGHSLEGLLFLFRGVFVKFFTYVFRWNQKMNGNEVDKSSRSCARASPSI